ncbi:MAG: hypothetical protein K6L60_04300 [Oceanobacter sp.]
MANILVESQLSQIEQIVKNNAVAQCSELESVLGKEISEELCSVLLHSDQLNKIKQSNGGGYFWGHDFIAYNELISQYEKKTRKYTFFWQWGVDDNLNVHGALNDGYRFFLEYDFDGGLEPPLVIKDVKSLIPILFFEGEFILYSMGEGGLPKGLMSVSSEGFGSMIAPSISEHIDDLISGVQEGIYPVGEDGVVFPHNWFDRIRLRNGKIQMNEYGEIIESKIVDDKYSSDPEFPGFVKKWLESWKN